MQNEAGIVGQLFEWAKVHPFELLGMATVALIVFIVWQKRGQTKAKTPPPIPDHVRRDLELLKRKREASFANPQAAQQKGITLADMAAFRPQREAPPKREEAAKAEKTQKEAVFSTLTQYDMQAAPLDDDLLYGLPAKANTPEAPEIGHPNENAPAGEKAAAQAEPTPGNIVRCPHCGREMIAPARFCSICGKKAGL